MKLFLTPEQATKLLLSGLVSTGHVPPETPCAVRLEGLEYMMKPGVETPTIVVEWKEAEELPPNVIPLRRGDR
jgi:hypothetical protein